MYLRLSALERCFHSRLRRALSGNKQAGKPTFSGGPPPGKLDAGRFEDAPVPAHERRLANSSVSIP